MSTYVNLSDLGDPARSLQPRAVRCLAIAALARDATLRSGAELPTGTAWEPWDGADLLPR